MSIGDDLRALKRRTLLVSAGNATARLMTLVVADKHGPGDPIRFSAADSVLDGIVRRYFGKVDAFKGENGFRNGDLINFSKIAGIFTLILLDERDAPLFEMPNRLVGSAYEGLMLPFYIYVLIGSILSLDLPRVDDEVESDFLRCLTLHPDIRADGDWLCWSMKLFQIAYGDPALSAP